MGESPHQPQYADDINTKYDEIKQEFAKYPMVRADMDSQLRQEAVTVSSTV